MIPRRLRAHPSVRATMTGPVRHAAALLATAILAACASSPPPPAPRRTALPPAATPEQALPGIDLTGLEPAQRELVAAWAQTAFSYCGAPRTVSVALRQGSTCRHAPRMAKLAAEMLKHALDAFVNQDPAAARR